MEFKLGMQSLNLKEDSSAALWLNNKLGSPTHLWSFSSTVVSQYSIEKLQSIKDCFPTLDSLVKFKFFLTLFHIPKRNLEEFKPIIQEIIDLTLSNCLDQWVLSIAAFLNSYWQTQSLNTDLDYEYLESYKESYVDLLKSFETSFRNDKGYEKTKYLLPIECDYLNNQARSCVMPLCNEMFSAIQEPSILPGTIDSLTSLNHQETSKSKNHFTLNKKNKLNSQLDELKLKASKYSKLKTTKTLANSSNLILNNESRLNENLNKPLPISTLTSSSLTNSSFFKRSLTSGLSSSSTITGKSSIKRDIGIKLLDVQEQSANPKEAKRKRKEQEKEIQKKLKQEEKEAKLHQQEVLKQQKNKPINQEENKPEETETENKKAESVEEQQLTNPALTSLNVKKEEINNNFEVSNSLNQNQHIETPLPSFSTNPPPSQIFNQFNNHQFAPPPPIVPPTQLPTPQLASFNDFFNSVSSQPQLQQQQIQTNNNSNNNSYFQSSNFSSPLLSSTASYNQSPTSTPVKYEINNSFINSNNSNLNLPTSSSVANSSINASSSSPSNTTQQQQHEVKKQQPSLTLTREQMLQAQEMFSNSNKLTRPEKALILGFIAGSRENPRPEHGPLLLIKLNESEEILTTNNGEQHKVLSELYFQMNYDTGEYRKIKKLKPLVLSANSAGI